MPYIYVGYDPIHHGRKLFKILLNLKNFGKGRIVYRCDEQKFPEPSFYKILLAQPQMDDKFEEGRVVVERVFRGLRQTKPINLSPNLADPDFRLVPKDEEEKFCRWSEVKDYVKELHAPLKPKHMEMPPLMKLVLARNRALKVDKLKESDFLLSTEKIYEEDVRFSDQVESNLLSHSIEKEFATFKDFKLSDIPEEWNYLRMSGNVGRMAHLSYIEGKDWEERKEREKLLKMK